MLTSRIRALREHAVLRKESVISGLSLALGADVPYFLNGGFWVGIGYAAIALFSLVQLIALTRFADQEFYGQYQFLSTIIAAVSLFSLPSMDSAITQSVASGHERALIIGTRTKIRWATLGSLILLVIAASFYFSQPDSVWQASIFIALLFPTFTAFTSVLAHHRGKENFRASAASTLLTEIAGTAAIVGALIVTHSLMWLFITYMTMTAIAYLYLYKKACNEVTQNTNDPELASYGRTLTFTAALSYLNPYLDKLLIAAMVGFADLAKYSVAISIPLYLSVGGKLFSQLLLPKLSRERPQHASQVKRLSIVLFAATALAISVLILIAPVLVHLLFTERYTDSIAPMRIALLSLLFLIPSAPLSAYAQGRKMAKLLYAYYLSTGILNIILLFALVPLIGIWGAIITKIIIGFFGLVVLSIPVTMTTRIKNQE